MSEAVIRREILILGAEDPGGLWEIAGRLNALSPEETEAGRLDVARAVLSSLLEEGLVSLVWSDGDFEPIRSIGRAAHQSLHHLIANAEWRDEAVLQVVREQVLPAIERHGPLRHWIIDDTGFPKKGRHSVGVARQYCGQLGVLGHPEPRPSHDPSPLTPVTGSTLQT